MSDEISAVERLKAELEANRTRQAELDSQAEDLMKVVEAGRDALGRAMAHGEPEKDLGTIRERTRKAADDGEATDRAITFLKQEEERLKADIKQATADEWAETRDRLVPEAISAVHELAEELDRWLLEFIPQLTRVEELIDGAFTAERKTAKANGTTLPRRSQVVDDGWSPHPGVYGMARLLKRYAEDPVEFGGWYYRLTNPISRESA